MKDARLFKKVSGFLRKAGLPVFLHRFGPKKYLFAVHFLCLLLKQATKMSYRRVSRFLSDLGFVVPTYSALCYCLKRLSVKQLELLLQATTRFRSTIVAAVDGLYFSQVNPSYAYLQRVKRGFPRKSTQCVGVIDTHRKKWLGIQTRRNRIGEYKLAKKALTKLITIVSIIVGDKGFDINDFHHLLKRLGIKAVIPVKKGIHRGFFRNFMRQFYRTRTYHRRSIIESAISRLKRLYGNFLYSRKTIQQRKEVLLRLIADNLNIGKTKIFN
jgi:hypothetical protein